MEDGKDIELAFDEWQRTFRANARADGNEMLRSQLKRLELSDDPVLLLEGTVQLVQLCVAYLALDFEDAREFLSLQSYLGNDDCQATYSMTFDLHGKAYARINVPATLSPIDLADLYGTPWNDYRVVGFRDVWISRRDGLPLTSDEFDDLESIVADDLRFDYDESELSFWFDRDSHDGVLKVTVQDVYDDDEIYGRASTGGGEHG